MLHADDEVIEGQHDAADAEDRGHLVRHLRDRRIGTDKHALVGRQSVDAEGPAPVRLSEGVLARIVVRLRIAPGQRFDIGAGLVVLPFCHRRRIGLVGDDHLQDQLLGAYGAAATLGKTANVVAGLSTGWFALLLFLIVIALDNWTINVLNLYTGGLSLSNIFERLGRFWTTVIISILGIALSATPSVVQGYTTYVGMLGNVFAPIAGVLIADYIFVKRGHIDLVGLFEPNGPYWYWAGVNPVAVVWTALGFLAYMFVIPAEWIRVVVTVIVTGAGYWATIELMAPRFPQLARAARPALVQREAVEDLDWELALR